MRSGFQCWGLLLCVIGGEASGQGEIFTFQSGVTDDQFGAAVAGAGDVDADGVPDVIVGVPESWFIGASGAGKAVVYSGADGSMLYTFSGTNLGDAFGTAVDGVGDVNGDGHADFAVGETPPLALFGSGGRVLVYSGLDGAILHTFTGSGSGDRFGAAVSGAGDMNQDGVPDVVVGAPNTAQGLSYVGMVRAYSGADGAILLTKYGEAVVGSFATGDQLGFSVDEAGDVDGDGFDDILVGTQSLFIFTLGEGNYFHVLSGATGNALYTFFGDGPYDSLGAAVASAGDLNADGTPDFVAGAPFDSDLGFAVGGARTYSGADGAILHFLAGPAGGTGFGSDVRGLGDVDADGRDDLAIAGLPPFDGSDSVSARIYSGDAGVNQPLAAFVRQGSTLGLRLTLGAPGDVDGDGHADFLLGVPRVQGTGTAELIGPHLLAGVPLPSSSFALGDVLTGAITGKKERDEGRLLATPSTKLTLAVEVTDGNLKPIVAIHTVKDGKVGKKIAQWKVKGSKPLKKKLKKAGEYAVRVSGKGSTSGTYRVETSFDLPKEAEAHTTVESVKNTKDGEGATTLAAEATLSGFAGGRLDVVVTPHDAFTPTVQVIAPSGLAVPESHYTVSADGDARTLDAVPLLETGVYRVRVLGGAKGDDVTFAIAPSLPPSGLLLEID